MPRRSRCWPPPRCARRPPAVPRTRCLHRSSRRSTPRFADWPRPRRLPPCARRSARTCWRPWPHGSPRAPRARSARPFSPRSTRCGRTPARRRWWRSRHG
ncbi:MAG: hypothetical protein FGM39_12300 [Phycisphaerales bacterium]|nr:hypothetical protein [Phycisphaerales bacterium]